MKEIFLMVFFMPSCAFYAIVLQRNVIFALDLILWWYGPTLCIKDDDIFASFVWYMKRQYLYMKFILSSIFSLMWLISASKTFITNWKNTRYSPMVYSPISCRSRWEMFTLVTNCMFHLIITYIFQGFS